MYCKMTIISLLNLFILTSYSFSQPKDELILELKELNQNMNTFQQSLKGLAKSTSTNRITDIKKQIHTIKKKMNTNSNDLDNPIYFNNYKKLDQNVDLLDFYVYEYSENYYEIHARLENNQRKYLEWVKLRYSFYSNGSFIGTDYAYIDFETYGYSGISPYKYSFIEGYIDKANFDSIAYQVEYDVENVGHDIMWDQILNLQSVAVQPSDNLHKWQGVVNNNFNYSVKFPKIYACVFKDEKMICSDYAYLDVQNDSLPANSSGIFDSYIDLPSDYDEIKYFLGYSPYSLNGSGNLPPNIPIFTNKNYYGLTRERIPFNIFVFDPNAELTDLLIDFSDGSSMNWRNNLSYASNSTIQHSFETDGHYLVKAKSKDGSNFETEWSENINAYISSSTSPKIVQSDLDTAYYKMSYSTQIRALNGIPPYLWKIESGSLPDGLTLNSNGGSISGLPIKSGNFSFSISTTDAGSPSLSDSSTFSIFVVNNCPVISSDDTILTVTDTQITYVAKANDPDGNSVTYDFIDYPQWLSKTSTSLKGITPNAPLDTSFSVIATDGELNDTLKVALIIKEQTSASTHESIPKSVLFYPNYPNPFNPITNIKIGVPSKTDLSISIYNINGRIVDTIFKGKLDPGYHNFIWYAMNILRFPRYCRHTKKFVYYLTELEVCYGREAATAYF